MVTHIENIHQGVTEIEIDIHLGGMAQESAQVIQHLPMREIVGETKIGKGEADPKTETERENTLMIKRMNHLKEMENNLIMLRKVILVPRGSFCPNILPLTNPLHPLPKRKKNLPQKFPQEVSLRVKSLKKCGSHAGRQVMGQQNLRKTIRPCFLRFSQNICQPHLL